MEVFFPGSNSEEERLNGTEIGVIIDGIMDYIAENYAKEDIYHSMVSVNLFPKKISDGSVAIPVADGAEVFFTVVEKNSSAPNFELLTGSTLILEVSCSQTRNLEVYGNFSYKHVITPSGNPISHTDKESRVGIGYSLTKKEYVALSSFAERKKLSLEELLLMNTKKLIKESKILQKDKSKE